MSKEETINAEIAAYVKGEVDGEVVSTEENCGSMWITTDSGKVYSVMIMQCEPDNLG
jgi:hypothetical protein